MPFAQDLVRERAIPIGGTAEITLFVTDNDNEPFPIPAGAVVRADVKEDPEGVPVISKTSVDPGQILIDPDQSANPGKLTIFLTKADTFAREPDVIFWDVLVIDGTDLRYPVEPGSKIEFARAITLEDAPAPAFTGAAYEREPTIAVPLGNSGVEITTGIVSVPGSNIGLAIKLENEVTGGTVVVTVKAEGVPLISLTLNTSTPGKRLTTIPIPNVSQFNAGDEITVEVVGTGYANLAAAASTISVNVLLSIDSPLLLTSSLERLVTAAVPVGGSVSEFTTGIIAIPFSAVGLSAKLEDDVTAGSVTVNLKVEGVVKMTVILDTSNPFKKFDTELPGVLRGVAGDEISIEVIGAAYDNVGSVTSAISVNALLSP